MFPPKKKAPPVFQDEAKPAPKPKPKPKQDPVAEEASEPQGASLTLHGDQDTLDKVKQIAAVLGIEVEPDAAGESDSLDDEEDYFG